MTTYVIYSSAANSGYVESSGTAAAVLGGTGTSTATVGNAASYWGWEISGNYFADQLFLDFDTSSVVGTISSATLNLYLNKTAGTLNGETPVFELRLYDYGTSLTTADYRTGTQYNALTRLAYLADASISSGARGDFTSEAAFAANINQSGHTRMVGCTSVYAAGTTPLEDSHYYDTDLSGTSPSTLSPRLTVVTSNSASFAVTGAADTAAFVVTARDNSSFALTETADAASFAANVKTNATFAATETADAAAFAVTNGVPTITFALTETADAAAFTIPTLASFALTEAVDTAAFAANVNTNVSFALAEAADVAAFAIQARTNNSFAITEAPDTAAFAATAKSNASFAIAETADAAAFSGLSKVSATFAIAEQPDGAAFITGLVAFWTVQTPNTDLWSPSDPGSAANWN